MKLCIEILTLVFVFFVKLEAQLQKSYDDCTLDVSPGTLCTLDATQLVPTQFGCGMQEVMCKKGHLESMSKSDRKDYLEDHLIPVVVGPDGYYLTDHHHLGLALLLADVSDKTVYCNITENINGISSKDMFWEVMMDSDYVWLYDEKGMQPVDPNFLPSTLLGMLNDPYRSLAWLISTEGGYGDSGIPFADFQWANFLRENIPLNISSQRTKKKKETGTWGPVSWSYCDVRPWSQECFPDEYHILNEVLPKALALALSPKAQGLPGYKQGVPNPPNCG